MSSLKIGRIDLHSHVLPGIDDGCVSVTDSLKCVKELKSRGFVGTVCTPHIIRDQFPENIPERISEWVATLREKLACEGIEYELWEGGEIRIAPGLLPWFDQIGIPTLGESRYVLIDWWERAWPDYGFGLCRDFLAGGYQPILAHPERMCLESVELFRLIDELKEMGVWLQGNFNSLGGGEGPQASSWSQTWLNEGKYDLLATDMHRPEMLTGRFRGIDEAVRLVGDEMVDELLSARPRMIVTGEVGEKQASAA